MSKERIAYPSLNTISYKSGCSKRTVQNEISKLVKHGWLEKIGRQKNKMGKFGSTKYKILKTDLIRSGGMNGFIDKPVATIAIGD